MKTGFAQRDITPDRSMAMAGFDRRLDPSRGTLDGIEVCVLALADQQDAPFLMCVFDFLGTDISLCTHVRDAISSRLAVATERIWVCATHTHSAPAGHLSDDSSYDKDYVNFLTVQTVAAAEEAMAALRESEAAQTTTHAVGVASLRNRGREGSEFPMPFPLVFLENRESPALLARISCHPTVLDERNLLYSRDLPGQLRDGLKARWNSLVVNGPCADLSTRFTRRASDPAELKRMGRILTDAVLAAQPEPAPGFGRRIRTAEQVLCLPLAANLSAEQRDSLLTALRKKAAECTDPQMLREYDSRIIILERPEVPVEKSRTIRIGAVNLGGTILVGVPFEVDYGDGLELEQTLSQITGQQVLVVCYAFGYEGYLPSGAPLSAESSYEDIASQYAPESREQVWSCARQCVLEVM